VGQQGCKVGTDSCPSELVTKQTDSQVRSRITPRHSDRLDSISTSSDEDVEI